MTTTENSPVPPPAGVQKIEVKKPDGEVVTLEVVKPVAHLIVVEKLHHRFAPGYTALDTSGTGTTSVPKQFSRALTVPKPPNGSNRVASPETWERLDTGWVDDPGTLHFQNREIPGPGRVLLVGVGGNPVAFCRVQPGETARFEPVPGAAYFVRTESGPVRYVCTSYPR